MAQDKKVKREPVSIEVEGQTYTGELLIFGTRKLTFQVQYKGRQITDSRAWGTDAGEQYNLRVMAQAHLVTLVYEERET